MERGIVYFVVAVLAILAVGFAGYYFGFLGFIYNVMLPNALSNYNLIILSAIFGIAAFFSPCAFTVLPAYVSYYLAKEEEAGTRFAKALYFGLVAAVGIITVNILIGLIIASLGAAAPFAKDPRQDIAYILAVRAIMGAVIAVMGFLTLTGRPLNLQFVQDIISRWEFAKSVYFYGIVYNAAAIGCTGPILLGLMLYAFASGSFVFAITAFGVFSLTMGALMVALTLLTAAFKQAIVGRMARITPLISKIAGAVMVLAGLAIVVLTLEGNNLFVEIFFPYLHETDELAVANESIRLESLASTRDLTPEDLEKLETLTRNHPRLREEFEEVDWMVRHGYQLHAQHSLESIFWIAEGIERFCPAETLSHVRPYLEWDETELALRSAEEAEKEFPEWEIYARGVKEKHPDAFPGLDELLNTMKNVISDVRSGDYSAAKTDAGYLEERGYC